GIAVDSSDYVYVTGYSESGDWTSAGGRTYDDMDVFVAKLSSGGAHVWNAYLGGTESLGELGRGIAVDGSDNVYVTGYTESSGWTSNGFDTSYNGGDYDAFVAKLNTNGEHVWSTYLGGDVSDGGYGVAVDSAYNVYVTGYTGSVAWPNGGYDTSYNGGTNDAFVAKLDADGQHVWSTYLGGSNEDVGRGIAVGPWDNVYVTGYTASSGWTSDGLDSTYNGGTYDAFAAKFRPGKDHVWSMYIGGDNSDSGYGIAVNSAGYAYVAGTTYSLGWTTGEFGTTFNGGLTDAFAMLIRGVPDLLPPEPNPSTWATEPYASAPASIRMIATPAFDDSGVEYYFHETTGRPGATDSGWQDSNTYEDTGLLAGTTYSYQVKTRDKSVSQHETGFSNAASATTGMLASQTPKTPSGQSPANGANPVSVTPILRSSVFEDPDAGDIHQASQWQVDNNSDFSSPVWDNHDMDADKTTDRPAPDVLLPATTYDWRVRHQDNRGVWSEWSDARSFTTCAAHAADTDYDWVVGDFELLDYIDRWVDGNVGDFELLDTIDLWAAGRYYWDEADGSYKAGNQPLRAGAAYASSADSLLDTTGVPQEQETWAAVQDFQTYGADVDAGSTPGSFAGETLQAPTAFENDPAWTTSLSQESEGFVADAPPPPAEPPSSAVYLQYLEQIEGENAGELSVWPAGPTRLLYVVQSLENGDLKLLSPVLPSLMSSNGQDR
ncbi:MAG: SBBP repeat-containing protein, partial [Planctomycetes bacterium]|nr:SBBP repeat-containing protein [Planctomycetota bacterium]